MIPKKVFFKKFFFEIAPFIKPEHFFSFKIFRPTLKHLAMYEFDLCEILSKVWHYSSDADTHTVETHIYRLRKKINGKFLDENFILNNKDGYYI